MDSVSRGLEVLLKKCGFLAGLITLPEEDDICKICLEECPASARVRLEGCGCFFCRECMQQYVSLEVLEGAYTITCPDMACPNQTSGRSSLAWSRDGPNKGVLSQAQLETLADPGLMAKHRTFRLNREVSLDAGRAWCPSPGCETICQVGSGTTKSQLARDRARARARARAGQGMAVSCPTCLQEFCSLCSSSWHPGVTCGQNGAWENGASTEKASDPDVKRCPTCGVPIEKDGGCVMMWCTMCEQFFCWPCSTPFDKVAILWHYRSGRCPGRTPQVWKIFQDFLILLFVLDALFVELADPETPGIALQKPSVLLNSLAGSLIGFLNLF